MNTSTARIIGQVLENYWGTSSSQNGTSSITYDLSGDILTLKYVTVVHFASETSLNPQVVEAERQAVSLLKDKLKLVKDAYKADVGEALKTNDLGGRSDMELLQPLSTRKTSYFRYNHSFKLED
tara:strand:+ start:228 stop:599 length:372 start_codon:yes stop_codon:yes gene_type:complete